MARSNSLRNGWPLAGPRRLGEAPAALLGIRRHPTQHADAEPALRQVGCCRNAVMAPSHDDDVESLLFIDHVGLLSSRLQLDGGGRANPRMRRTTSAPPTLRQ